MNFTKKQITIAQYYKIIAPLVSIICFIVSLIDVSHWFFRLTRPSALYQILILAMQASIMIFTVGSSLPMQIRFKNKEFRITLIKLSVLLGSSAAVGYLYIEMLTVGYIKYLFEPGSTSLNSIFLALFFLSIIIQELGGKNTIVLIYLFGFAYIITTLCIYTYTDYHMSKTTVSELVSINILLFYYIIFRDLKSAFNFSALKYKKYYFIDNPSSEEIEIEFAHVISYTYMDGCLHIALYTSQNFFIDCYYEPLSEILLASTVSFESTEYQRFLIATELYKIERSFTYTRI